MTFNERLQKLRKNSNMKQEDVAEKLNVTRQTISKWECGESTPDFSCLIEISRLFDVTTDYLLMGMKSKEEPPVSPQALDVSMKKHKFSGVKVVGAFLFGAGMITNLALFISAMVHLSNYSIDGKEYGPIMGYLAWYNLTGLFCIMWVSIVVGLVLLILSPSTQKIKSYFQVIFKKV